MRAEQFRLYQLSTRSMSMVYDVLPFYLTWLILTIVFLKEDVSWRSSFKESAYREGWQNWH